MSASASYLNPVDLITYYDKRRVLQLASDDPAVPAVLADLSNASSAAYTFVLACIRSAASALDSHCQQGKRYTRATLEEIVTAAVATPANEGLQKRAALIYQLVADLAYGILVSRRGYVGDALKNMAPRYEQALVTLERLHQGFQVFDIDDNITAGAPSSVAIGKNKYKPSTNNRMFGIFPDTVPGLFGYCR